MSFMIAMTHSEMLVIVKGIALRGLEIRLLQNVQRLKKLRQRKRQLKCYEFDL